MKNIKKILIYLCICLLFVSCGDNSVPKETDDEEIYRIRNVIKKEKWIIHAGGIQDNSGKLYTYTNSKNALLNCRAKGNNISEIDFRISSDNCLVCTHEWTMMYKNGVALSDYPVTKDEFLECKTHGGFTSMWLGDLVEFLEENPDFLFITDIKDNNVQGCSIIADYCPKWKDNFIIQIYHASEYDQIRALGFRNIIYTLYASSAEEREVNTLLVFAQNHELIGFTYWADWQDTYLQPFLAAGYSSYVHTVNDIEERNALLNLGIEAIYTDIVDN